MEEQEKQGQTNNWKKEKKRRVSNRSGTGLFLVLGTGLARLGWKIVDLIIDFDWREQVGSGKCERDVGYQKHHSGAGGCQGQGGQGELSLAGWAWLEDENCCV